MDEHFNMNVTDTVPLFNNLYLQGGSILQDLRRLNVAITRAKHKLLLIGSMKVLNQFQPLKTLLSYLSDHNMVSNKLRDVNC